MIARCDGEVRTTKVAERSTPFSRRMSFSSAHFRHAAIAELSPVSGISRKLDFEPAKGCFWRKAASQWTLAKYHMRLKPRRIAINERVLR